MQGEAQCCVTGPALEQLLQLGDLPLLETVMRNVVVFSRMKPHQKGQVMDLLSTRGLHQLIDGQQQHLPVRACSLLPFVAVSCHCLLYPIVASESISRYMLHRVLPWKAPSLSLCLILYPDPSPTLCSSTVH